VNLTEIFFCKTIEAGATDCPRLVGPTDLNDRDARNTGRNQGNIFVFERLSAEQKFVNLTICSPSSPSGTVTTFCVVKLK
jgi:hypothetical protein